MAANPASLIANLDRIEPNVRVGATRTRFTSKKGRGQRIAASRSGVVENGERRKPPYTGEVWSRMGPHEEFLKLAALAAGGEVSAVERQKLDEHLASCRECREAQAEFQAVVDHAIPTLVSDSASHPFPEDPSFSQETAEASFRKRLDEEGEKSRAELPTAEPWLSSHLLRRSHRFRRSFDRYHFYMPLAASVIFALSLGILAYRMGKNRGSDASQSVQTSGPVPARSSEEPGAVGRERLERLDAQFTEREKVIAELRREIAASSSENTKLKATQAEQQAALATASGNQKQWNDDRNRMTQEVTASREALAASEKKLQNLERRSFEDALHASTLESKTAELSRALGEEQRMNDELRELLAKDQDLRELMGARDLYIAEVHDILTTGETRKAFGHLFYKKGKSLIFYVFDLSDLPGLKPASTFEVWGNRGADRAQAIKLGMLYEDNVPKKRWVMKFNDEKTLGQIDAVFVTVEPPGGSKKPSGVPLMYAYLKVDTNHP